MAWQEENGAGKKGIFGVGIFFEKKCLLLLYFGAKYIIPCASILCMLYFAHRHRLLRKETNMATQNPNAPQAGDNSPEYIILPKAEVTKILLHMLEDVRAMNRLMDEIKQERLAREAARRSHWWTKLWGTPPHPKTPNGRG